MSSTASIDLRLEEQLRRAQLISEEQLTLVKELQQESPLSLAQAIVELDLLSSMELERIVESIHEVRFVKLEEMQIDREAVRHVPARIARQYRCIPVRRSGNMLVVAAANPAESGLRDALFGVTDCELLILAAEPEAVEHALFLHYSVEALSANAVRNTASIAKERFTHDPWEFPRPWMQTFDTFIEHDGSQRARELAKQVASDSTEPIDYPIILVGGSGSGKSHLLMAIKNYCSAHDPLKRGLYCLGGELAENYWDYEIAGQAGYFRYEFRDRQIILIDNFAGCFGDEVVEREVAQMIAHCVEVGARIVLTLTPEQRITGPVTPELRTRLDKGTEVEIRVPQHEALQAVVNVRTPNSSPLRDHNRFNDQTAGQGWEKARNCIKACGPKR